MTLDKDDVSELDIILKDMGGVDKIEDFTNNYEKLPDGSYVGEIESVESKNAKGSGKPMIEILVAVENGKKEYAHLMLAGKDLDATRKAIATTFSKLRKLGIDATTVEELIAKAETTLVGKRVIVIIKTTITKSTGNDYRNVDLELA